MNKAGHAVYELQKMDQLAKEDHFLNRIHPLVKLFLTGFFVVLTVSFHRYDLAGLAGMIIYPLVLFSASELSFPDAVRRLKIVLPFIIIMGIFNPFFDHTPVYISKTAAVPGGVISMLTLMLKGVLTVLSSYLLIATTPIESICHALRKIHVPQLIVIEILLIYRYAGLFLSEASRISQAYSLRAPGQKGIAVKAWGPLLGQMLLRSVDRAGEVYAAMTLRGFTGEFPDAELYEKHGTKAVLILYLFVWTAVLLILRAVPVMVLVGRLVV